MGKPFERREATGYNVTDLRLVIAYVLLGTWEKAAEFGNMTIRNVHGRRLKNVAFFAEMTGILQEAMRLRRRDVPEIDGKNQVEALNRLYGKSIAVAEEALDMGDTATARELIRENIDRTHGKARQTLDIQQKTTVVHQLPPEVSETLKMIGEAAQRSQRLYLGPPILDVEEVMDGSTHSTE